MITDSAFNAYLETALWSSTDQDGDPLSDHCEVSDIDASSLANQRKECEDFVQTNNEAIALLLRLGIELETVMHDFWLTRNGHGAGFWDSPAKYDPFTQQLTESSKSYGSVDPYIGDDGWVYFG